MGIRHIEDSRLLPVIVAAEPAFGLVERKNRGRPDMSLPPGNILPSEIDSPVTPVGYGPADKIHLGVIRSELGTWRKEDLIFGIPCDPKIGKV